MNEGLRQPDVYFGTIDRQMEAFLSAKSFRRSLVYGVLFHGNLVAPDIFLYIGSRLERLITSDELGRDFVKACVRYGALVSAFRSDTGGDYFANLREIRGQGIQGLHPNADAVASFFQEATGGMRPRYRLWPSEPVSVGYRTLVERTLLADRLPPGTRRLERFWEGTRDLREGVIAETAADGLRGFRRGDLYNSLAARVGREGKVEDVRSVWRGMPQGAVATRARRLLKWMNYAYHFNQGKMFALQPALTSMDGLDCEFARLLAELQSDSEAAPGFRQAFRFPSVQQLLTVNPELIFQVRNFEEGRQYFIALAAWQDRPTEEAAQILLDRLERYAARLTGLYVEHGRSIVNPGWCLRALVPAGPSRWKSFGTAAGEAAARELIGGLIPGFGLTSLVGRFAAAVYESMPRAAQLRYGWVTGAKSRVRIESEPQTSRLVAEEVPKAKVEASFA